MYHVADRFDIPIRRKLIVIKHTKFQSNFCKFWKGFLLSTYLILVYIMDPIIKVNFRRVIFITQRSNDSKILIAFLVVLNF